MDTKVSRTIKFQRMLAAYKLRLARKAALGARAETWGLDEEISVEVEQRRLRAEDKYRIAPYPYPGLRSFDPEEGEIFFGRKRNIEEVRALLVEHRMVAVLGGSGSGKSSLLRAGLLPFLNTDRRIPGRNGNWYNAEFRPRTDPLGELAVALADQLLLPLLKLRKPGLAEAMGLPLNTDVDAESVAALLRNKMRQRFIEAKTSGREAVLETLLEVVDCQLDEWDNRATQGHRLAEPSLLLLIDQLEEVFRPEVADDQRETLLNLIVDLHARMKGQKRGTFLAVTMRSEEVHRCAEHRGLSEAIVGSGYQLELLDANNEDDRADLRLAIVQPARNVFEDWGLGESLVYPDAPFAPGMPDLLLRGAIRLSVELDHRPDQLPLLQHALQATWHQAMRRWSGGNLSADSLEITPNDVPGFVKEAGAPDLGACLNLRADKAAERAAQRFADIAGTTKATGEQALQAVFRALARRDDKSNWARRFASKRDITVFLDAEPHSPLVQLSTDLRWDALRQAIHVFLLRGYLSGGDGRDYDISHEALIRNWRRFQNWLRDPEEVAYALTRVLLEVKPAEFESLDDKDKMRLIPSEVAARVAMVTEGLLPGSWGADQIAPVLLRPAVQARWGGRRTRRWKR